MEFILSVVISVILIAIILSFNKKNYLSRGLFLGIFLLPFFYWIIFSLNPQSDISKLALALTGGIIFIFVTILLSICGAFLGLLIGFIFHKKVKSD